MTTDVECRSFVGFVVDETHLPRRKGFLGATQGNYRVIFFGKLMFKIGRPRSEARLEIITDVGGGIGIHGQQFPGSLIWKCNALISPNSDKWDVNGIEHSILHLDNLLKVAKRGRGKARGWRTGW